MCYCLILWIYFVFLLENYVKMNTIALRVEPYLAAWMEKHFGNPVILIKDSPESRLLKRLLDKQPEDISMEDGNIFVSIPFFKEKDPRVFSYLCGSAKCALIESFESIFLNNMWTEIGDLKNINCQLTSVIKAWCEKHGIIVPVDRITDVAKLKLLEEQNAKNFETVRQKYYRMRKKYYKECNVKLS